MKWYGGAGCRIHLAFMPFARLTTNTKKKKNPILYLDETETFQFFFSRKEKNLTDKEPRFQLFGASPGMQETQIQVVSLPSSVKVPGLNFPQPRQIFYYSGYCKVAPFNLFNLDSSIS